MIHTGNMEKNKKTEMISNLIEKAWILGVIGLYLYLYFT